jgi:thymidylate synthase
MTLSYHDVNDAFPALLHRVMTQGDLVESRNGRTKELTMQQITLEDPSVKELTTPGRRVSLPAQIAETMWILAGRNDVEWLSHYLPRAKEFSDDGKTWRGGYGPRLRTWKPSEDSWQDFDQLKHVVDLLKEDPNSRRAVFTIYNPAIDNEPGKDIPCNNWVHFLPREGVLHAHVAIRSNDLFWGWSGINHFEWTSLLQVVAGLTGLERGSITFSISSLHLYEHHWDRAEKMLDNYFRTEQPAVKPAGPAFKFRGSMEDFDYAVQHWFDIEGQIRKGGISTALMHQIGIFPEPMLRSWLFVLLAWTHDDIQFVEHPYRGTSLAAATALSPKRKNPEKVVGIQPGEEPILPLPVGEISIRKKFTAFASNLHAEKHAAYGDSWKKRGEMLGIMANIARKVDRLGVAGGGDTAADTAIDLLMYLIKYNLWLEEQRINSSIDEGKISYTTGEEHVDRVNVDLEHLQLHGPEHRGLGVRDLITDINAKFDRLEHWVEEKRSDRGNLVQSLIQLAYPLAIRLWAKEEWQKGNETRSFSYEQPELDVLVEP